MLWDLTLVGSAICKLQYLCKLNQWGCEKNSWTCSICIYKFTTIFTLLFLIYNLIFLPINSQILFLKEKKKQFNCVYWYIIFFTHIWQSRSHQHQVSTVTDMQIKVRNAQSKRWKYIKDSDGSPMVTIMYFYLAINPKTHLKIGPFKMVWIRISQGHLHLKTRGWGLQIIFLMEGRVKTVSFSPRPLTFKWNCLFQQRECV